MVREKIVVLVHVMRVLEIDGVDSMCKDLSVKTVEFDSESGIVDRFLSILREGLQNVFTFL